MPLNALLSSRNKLPRDRSPALRRVGLLWRRARRAFRHAAMRVTLFGGWVWFAAGSLIGFEAFDILFGTFAFAPELLPLVIVGLALIWYCRGRVRRASTRARARTRLRRLD